MESKGRTVDLVFTYTPEDPGDVHEFEIIDLLYDFMHKEYGFEEHVFDWKENQEMAEDGEKMYSQDYVSWSPEYSQGEDSFTIFYVKSDKEDEFLDLMSVFNINVDEVDATDDDW